MHGAVTPFPHMQRQLTLTHRDGFRFRETYIHTHIHTYIHTDKHTYVRSMYIHTYLHTHRHTYVRSMYVCTYMHAYICTYVHTDIHMYVHTYMLWIQKYIINAVGCGTSHKYTYTNLQCTILQSFYKNIINHLYTYKIHLQSTRSVYVHIFLRLL
jgi:hypothetical protein